MSDLTKKALASSLKEILKTKPISKVTVSDICSNCGIRRQSFYYHFADLPELVEWICWTEGEEALKKNKGYDGWEEGFYNIFLAAKKEKPFIMNIYHSVSGDTLRSYLFRLTMPLLQGVVEEIARAVRIQDITESDKCFIERFYSSAFVDVMLEWVARDMEEDPKAIIEHLSPLVKGTIPNALNAYSGRNQ